MMEQASKNEPVVDEYAVLWSYAQFRAKFKVDKDQAFSKQLDELRLTASDRVVLAHHVGLVLIRIREGTAKIVGIVR
jgi:hypothetical protein